MKTKRCNKCNKHGSFFKKLYDTEIGYRGVITNKKGQTGIWIRCPKCLGTTQVPVKSMLK